MLHRTVGPPQQHHVHGVISLSHVPVVSLDENDTHQHMTVGLSTVGHERMQRLNHQPDMAQACRKLFIKAFAAWQCIEPQ